MRLRSNPLTLTVNLAAGMVLSLCLVLGQLLFLRCLPGASAGELSWLGLGILLHSSALVCGALLVGGCASRWLPDWTRGLLWMGACLLSTFWFWDYFSYRWVSLHLDEVVWMLLQNARTDFRVMPGKMMAVVLGLFAQLVAWLGGGWWLGRLSRRFPALTRPLAVRRLIGWGLLSLLLLAVQQAATPRLLQPTIRQSSQDALWQLRLTWRHSASAGLAEFVIDAPRFRSLPDDATVRAALTGISQDRQAPIGNVFLFVIDSLRQDCLTETIAPNLCRFQRITLNVRHGVAAANCTHISWFSVLHAAPPLYWSVLAHQRHSDGAVPIRILKAAGYRVQVLATPRLDYFGFARSVFGDDQKLADSFIDQPAILKQLDHPSVGDLDAWIMRRLGADLDHLPPRGRSFYLIMLDAPHHDYSWAADFSPPFRPYMEPVPLTPGAVTPANVGLLENRYHNAVHFTDALFGQFLDKLRARGLLGSSLIIVTGDHGEEFLERGHLVHSSDLNGYQLSVPILIHIPGLPDHPPSIPIASHLDIFPTILDGLGLGPVARRLLTGHSLLESATQPQALSAQCSSFSPHRLLIDDGDRKLVLELEGVGKLGRTLYARRLVATRLLDADYRELPPSAAARQAIAQRFQPALRKGSVLTIDTR
ncbi:MAG: sulfatase-like hydrolase/transferase [Verrucomicrobia bacterium]|nr:sulfatase-like hydrolase/transferase [Verrucomicrobiota bacterium]